jgi:hypothetical protein
MITRKQLAAILNTIANCTITDIGEVLAEIAVSEQITIDSLIAYSEEDIVKINYKGMDIFIEYEYEPDQKETLTDPPFSEELTATAIYYNDTDIITFIDDRLREQFEIEALKKLKEERDEGQLP